MDERSASAVISRSLCFCPVTPAPARGRAPCGSSRREPQRRRAGGDDAAALLPLPGADVDHQSLPAVVPIRFSLFCSVCHLRF
jgi:hypothetical protein